MIAVMISELFFLLWSSLLSFFLIAGSKRQAAL